jgi:hypothetical protein
MRTETDSIDNLSELELQIKWLMCFKGGNKPEMERTKRALERKGCRIAEDYSVLKEEGI